MPTTFAPDDGAATPLLAVAPEGLEALLAGLAPREATWARAQGFRAGPGEALALPDENGGMARALIGLGAPGVRARHRFALARGAGLPAGTYRLEGLADAALREAALGWLLEGYRYGRYKDTREAAPARLVPPEGIDALLVERLAQAERLTRDLVNAPASDMGPAELEAVARDLAQRHGGRLTVTTGDALLDANLPLIHAVGRAAAPGREPRLIDLSWGEAGPSLVLVGKGVCFDTGGLDLKPAASMLLMKKDMGGAATVLGLAGAIMEGGLPLRLRVLIPAVENSVGPASFRPGDILRSRKGLSVEVNNTDAEGRLVLADALALAGEGEGGQGPDLTVSYATLTGAARVALGPDLPPFFTDDDALALALQRGGDDWFDPVWRLPFHAPYEALIEPAVADLDNAPAGGMAGAITAALFLRRFAPPRYLHLDVFCWQPVAAPGRPKGGVGQGARALYAALPEALGL